MGWNRALLGAAAGLASLVVIAIGSYGAVVAAMSAFSLGAGPDSDPSVFTTLGIFVLFGIVVLAFAIPGLALGAGRLRVFGAAVVAGVAIPPLVMLSNEMSDNETYLIGVLAFLAVFAAMGAVRGRGPAAWRCVPAVRAGAAVLSPVSTRIAAGPLGVYGALAVAAVPWAILPGIAGAMTGAQEDGQ